VFFCDGSLGFVVGWRRIHSARSSIRYCAAGRDNFWRVVSRIQRVALGYRRPFDLIAVLIFCHNMDSRGSIHRRSQARASNTRVSDFTLCPLGQSKKAIGHESQIGPCVATHKVDNCEACCFRNEWRRRNKGMEPQGRGNVLALRARERNKRLGLRKTTLESRVHVQTVGLNAETKKCRHRAEEETFLLTFPLTGLLRLPRQSRLCSRSCKRSRCALNLTNLDHW
jgi:hypothetical protein